jgi:hypothetical protein
MLIVVSDVFYPVCLLLQPVSIMVYGELVEYHEWFSVKRYDCENGSLPRSDIELKA